MAEHKYAQVLRWIADGKAVQCKARRGEWVELEEAGRALQSIGLGTSTPPEDYRLKPRTVKIGNREVKAPVLAPVAGQRLWYWDSMSNTYNFYDFDPSVPLSVEQAKRGEMFASEDDCRDATETWFGLLRGESC